MPGFILHMATAQMLFKKYNPHMDRAAFEVGNLIPDSVSDKTESHFRHPERQEKLMVYPDLDLFLDKYRPLLDDSSCLGYYFHLFIDRVYAKDYIPQIVSFHNEAGQEVSDRKDITHALIKRTGELVPIRKFFSDDYYYGDFTKMNTYLMNRFDLSIDLPDNVTNPWITEVNFSDITSIQKQLEGYLEMSENAMNELRVFEVAHLIDFLEMTVNQFAEKIVGL